jgi:hypothetical protein
VSDADAYEGWTLDQLWRNRLMDWLGHVSTVEAQFAYAHDLSFVYLPREIIIEGGDWDLRNAQSREILERACSAEELAALERLSEVMAPARELLRDTWPSIQEVQSFSEWVALRESAKLIEPVFALRGRSVEADEYWKKSGDN